LFQGVVSALAATTMAGSPTRVNRRSKLFIRGFAAALGLIARVIYAASCIIPATTVYISTQAVLISGVKASPRFFSMANSSA
jgi:hypothetical protein